MVNGARGDRVVVIGGGVSGALSAVRLAGRGFHVVLLEKGTIGNGSSSRSAAGIRAQFSTAETTAGMLYAEWWYMRLHEMLETPPERRHQPAIRQNGYLFLYEDARHPEVTARREEASTAWNRALAAVARQRALGVQVDVLGPDEIGARWPHLRVEHLVGATWCPTDGFLFPPVIYGEGVRRAEELGATVLQRAEVVRAEVRGRHVTSVVTTRGTVECDWVVNCTNAWAPRVSARLGGMPLAIEPVKRHLYVLRPERPVVAGIAWDRLPMTIYGMGTPLGAHSRPDSTSLLIAGNGRCEPEPEFSDEDQDRPAPGFDHRHGVDNFGYTLLAEVERFAPALANCGGLVATTCGFYAMTPDAMPLIGYDAVYGNLVHAAGFSGHGLMHAPVTATLVEALVTGEVTDGCVRLPPPFAAHLLDLRTFDPARSFARSTRESAVL